MSLTKSELVETIYRQVAGFSRNEIVDFLEILFETIKDTLGCGEKIKISGFGNFIIRDKKPRKGRNPQTGDEILISERRVLTFQPSKKLKEAVNE